MSGPLDARAAAERYRAASIEDAPPLKVVRLLYKGALRFLERAAASDPAGTQFADCIGRADAIVVELRLALAGEPAPELSAELERLYLFVEAELQRALRTRGVQPLEAARGVLARLLDAWDRVETAGA